MTKLLPGQVNTNGISNYLFGTNHVDYNSSFVTNTAIQQQLKANNIQVIRCPVEIGGTNLTDAQLDAMATAVANTGAAMLCILRESDLTFSAHVVSYLGSRCNMYEFSNEPDLNGITVSQYSTDWNANVPTWRASNPNAVFIGPALGAFSNLNSFLVPWLNNCVSSGVLPDAISWHDYPCTSSGSIPQATCLLDASNIGNDAATLRGAVNGVLGYNLPLCLTEWNIDANYGNSSHQSYSPNTPQNASFISQWTQAAMDSLATNGVALACEFELNAYLVDDSNPNTPEPQMQMMEQEYQKYIGSIPHPPASNTPYGFTRQLNFTSPLEIEKRTVTAATELGVSWARIIIAWNKIEVSSGVYHTTLAQGVGLDETIQRLNAAGIKAYFCLTGPPSFRKTQLWGGTYYYASTADMLSYATFIANRYKTGSQYGELAAIDIGNEDYTSTGIAPLQYLNGGWLADALNAIYPAVKAIDPNMLVISGAQLQCGKTFVTQFQTELYTGGGVSPSGGVGPNMDASNTHFYRGNKRDPNDPSFPGTNTITEQIQAIHAVDVAYGYPHRELWCTEFGFEASQNGTPGNDGLVTFAQQAQYIIEIIEACRQSGFVTHAFPYTLDTSDSNSLIGPGQPPVHLPSFNAYQTEIATYPTWSGGSNPPPVFVVSPTSLSSTSSGVTHIGPFYQASITLSETASSQGQAQWQASSSMPGVSFTPQSGTLTPSASVTIAVAGLPVTPGIITISGLEGESPVEVTWSGGSAPPPPHSTSAFVTQIRGNSPTAWYRLGDTNDSFASDSSGNGYTAKLTGATYGQPGSILGDSDTAMLFTASGGLTLPARLMAQIATWTVGGLEFNINLDGTWQYCGVAMNGATMTLYQQGQAVSSTPGGAISVSAMLDVIGSLTQQGLLDEVILYNYAPTAGQFLADYNATQAIGSGSATYTVTIDGNPVMVEAGSLLIDLAIGKRSTASFTCHTDTATHFVEDMQVAIYDNTGTLVFSGYLVAPQEQKPGFSASLEQKCTCCDQHRCADKRIIAAVFTNRTCGEIVQSIVTNYLAQEGVTIGQIYDGLPPSPTMYPSLTLYPQGNVGLVPTATFAYCTVAQALDQLVTTASGGGIPYYWMIDQYKQLWFVPYTAIVNNTMIDGTQLEHLNNKPTVTRSNPLYRNTQYIVGGTAQTLPQSETQTGDGTKTAFTMGYDLAQAPTVFINTGAGNVPQTVGVKGVSTGVQWYWQAGSPVITQDSSGTKLRGYPNFDTITVNYIGQYPNVALSQNQAQIQYEQGIDGTSGIVEEVETDKTLQSATLGISEADAFLARYGVQGIQFVGSTLVPGYAPGQSVIVDLPDHDILMQQMLINKVEASDQFDNYNIWYTLTGVIGPYDDSWEFFFKKMINQVTQAASINVGVSTNLVILVNMVASISLSCTLTVSSYSCPLPSSTLYPSLSLYPC